MDFVGIHFIFLVLINFKNIDLIFAKLPYPRFFFMSNLRLLLFSTQ